MSLAETTTRIDHLSEEERTCLENCLEAAEVCEWCAGRSVGDGEMADLARLCRDVADVASLLARWMARDSHYAPELAQVCAGVCEECAEVCERHDTECAGVCARVVGECAESCRSLVAG